MNPASKKIIILAVTAVTLVLLNLILLYGYLSKNPLVKMKNSPITQINQSPVNSAINNENLNLAQPNNGLITLDPTIILQSESIIKSLLGADNVIIHSNQEIADIDNDNREELVVFATIVGGQRPAIANSGEQQYLTLKNTDDLIVLGQNDDTSYQFKYYYIQAFPATNAPTVLLHDFNRDNIMDIILTTGQKEKQSYLNIARIYHLKNNQLQPANFSKGPFNGALEISGALEVEDSKGLYLNIYLDDTQRNTATYEQNNNGDFEFISTTSNPPSADEQKVIDYLAQNINRLVQAKPILGATSVGITSIQFYPANQFLVSFEDGHFVGYFLGQYAFDNDQVAIKYIDETTDYDTLNQFREKYNLDIKQAINYSWSINGYQKVNSDVFKF